MARPTKNNCDYFPHDRDMRDHRKIKAIRSKFGLPGYAIWGMLLEYLTGADGNEFEYSEMEFELMAGDFGTTAAEIKTLVDYCLHPLELLFNKNGFVHSESLDERLKPVYEKRKVAKEISKKQQRVNGKFVKSAVDTAVSVTEIPQSKEDKKEVNKKREKQTPTGGDSDAFIFYKNLEKDVEPLKEFIKNQAPQFIEPYIDYWNLFADRYGKAKVISVNNNRIEQFKDRIKESAFDFTGILKAAAESDYLKEKAWFTFDWIFKDENNYIKVLEGNYKKSESKTGEPDGTKNKTVTQLREELAKQESRFVMYRDNLRAYEAMGDENSAKESRKQYEQIQERIKEIKNEIAYKAI